MHYGVLEYRTALPSRTVRRTNLASRAAGRAHDASEAVLLSRTLVHCGALALCSALQPSSAWPNCWACKPGRTCRSCLYGLLGATSGLEQRTKRRTLAPCVASTTTAEFKLLVTTNITCRQQSTYLQHTLPPLRRLPPPLLLFRCYSSMNERISTHDNISYVVQKNDTQFMGCTYYFATVDVQVECYNSC